jgi:hypothetical protein
MEGSKDLLEHDRIILADLNQHLPTRVETTEIYSGREVLSDF